MSDPRDNTAARALLLAAADAIPDGNGHLADDLLAGVRASRTRSRRRTRITLSLGTATALAGGAIAAVLATTATSLVSTQTAYAAVTTAATTTSSQSFEMTLSVRLPEIVLGPRAKPVTGTGVFDPARQSGEAALMGQRILYTGGWVYLRQSPPYTDSHGKLWVASRGQVTLPIFGLTTGLGPLPLRAAASVTPQRLLGLLREARAVRPDGQASGPGWTGTRYAFSYAGGTGTVAVDRQGRVRELDLSIKTPYTTGGRPERFEQAMTRVTVAFGDFGVPVSVTAPPAREVDFS
jgi:hypothetical protein